MKLVIDIPDKAYKHIKSDDDTDIYLAYMDSVNALNGIYNGIPLDTIKEQIQKKRDTFMAGIDDFWVGALYGMDATMEIIDSCLKSIHDWSDTNETCN